MNNPFDYTTDPELKIVFDQLASLKAKVEAKTAQALRLTWLSEQPKFMPLAQVKIDLPTISSLRSGHGNTSPSLDSVEKLAREKVAAARLEIQKVREQNAAAILHNLRIEKAVIDVMQQSASPKHLPLLSCRLLAIESSNT